MSQQDDQKDAETEDEASGRSAIRSAYLARQQQGTGGAGGGESVAVTLRGVYVGQLSRQTGRRDDAVKGSEDTGGTIVRSIYAARAEAVVVTPRRAVRPAVAKKAKAAKKSRPARKAKSRPVAKAKVRRTSRAVAKRRAARKATRRRR
jgi:hypothetical protein